MVVPIMLNVELPFDLASPLFGYLPKRTESRILRRYLSPFDWLAGATCSKQCYLQSPIGESNPSIHQQMKEWINKM
jgi:hypothetical protein